MEIINNKFEFTEGYKNEVFGVWYKAGKPNSHALYQIVNPDPMTGNKPTQRTLLQWTQEFKVMAEKLDADFQERLGEMLIAEKIEMVKRHARIGQLMQDKAMEYINEVGLDSSPAAVRLLVEGIRIERESIGIPQAIEKLTKMSDESLLQEVMNILEKSEISIEQLPSAT
jgi:hypothetical protein